MWPANEDVTANDKTRCLIQIGGEPMADTKFGFTTSDGRDWADELEGMIRDGERAGEQLRLLKEGDALLKEGDPLLARKAELEAAGQSGFQINPADSTSRSRRLLSRRSPATGPPTSSPLALRC